MAVRSRGLDRMTRYPEARWSTDGEYDLIDYARWRVTDLRPDSLSRERA